MQLINELQHDKLLKSLIEIYTKSLNNNSAFSMRAFSKKIGISSGALSEIIQSKRRVTIKTAEKILNNLNYSPREIDRFFQIKESLTKSNNYEYKDLSLDQYYVLSSWHYLALLNLIELESKDHSISFFSKRLGLPVSKVNEAIKRLKRLEMIEEKEGMFLRTFLRYKTTEDISNSAIKKYHQEVLALGDSALREIEPELRDFSSIVLKLNIKNLKKIKDLIRNFQDDLCDLIEDDEPEEVYHLNLQLYPVTKIKKKRV